ncbi:unnamed protein product [Natator depressus]
MDVQLASPKARSSFVFEFPHVIMRWQWRPEWKYIHALTEAKLTFLWPCLCSNWSLGEMEMQPIRQQIGGWIPPKQWKTHPPQVREGPQNPDIDKVQGQKHEKPQNKTGIGVQVLGQKQDPEGDTKQRTLENTHCSQKETVAKRQLGRFNCCSSLWQICSTPSLSDLHFNVRGTAGLEMAAQRREAF